ncbi:MAG: hypothetical protein ACKOQ8_06680 [Micrococcales bacterium]
MAEKKPTPKPKPTPKNPTLNNALKILGNAARTPSSTAGLGAIATVMANANKGKKPTAAAEPKDYANPFGGQKPFSYDFSNSVDPGGYVSEGQPLATPMGQVAKPNYAPTYAPAQGAPLSLADMMARRNAGAGTNGNSGAGATTGGVAPRPGAANPGNISISAPLGARAQEEAAANRYGLTYTPGQAAGTAQEQYNQQQLRKMIEGNYAGATQSIANQITALNDRYGQNQADVKSIFGTLSTIRSADKAKINQQFIDSINAANQQQAARTAQAQQQLAANQQGAATAGAELGGGPAQTPTDSLTSQAVAQGIADSNANQSTWGNLMNAMNMQQQGNVDTSVQGYNLQQAGALDALRRQYEDNLLGAQNQQLSLQDQIAQAMSGVQSAGVQAQNEQALQALKNAGLTDVAKIRAAGQLAAKRAGGSGSGSSNKAPSYSKDIYGLQQRVNDSFGPDGFTNLVGTIDAARQLATQRKNAAAKAAGTTAKAPSKTEVMSAWKSVSGVPELLPFVNEYINKY